MATLLAGTEAGLVELTPDDLPATVAFAGRSVDALSWGPSGWWALVDAAEVWHVEGEGDWERHAAATGPSLTCLAATPAGLLVGTAEAHLARVTDGHLERVDAFDHAQGRDRWYTPWGGPPDTRSVSADADGTLFVNVHVGGILRSADHGRSWRPTIDIHADVHQVLAGAAPGLVLAACAEGLALSDDAGISWRIDDGDLHATYSRAVAATASTAVISTSTGPGGAHSALYRRRLAAAWGFERCRTGLPEWFDGNVDTGCLVADAGTVAAATGGGEVFVSHDEGVTWQRWATDLPPVRCLALA
ncbi:MAG: hypothetical protein M3P53_05175 [Actinomycetota bacterium]|nr:hypothetical protein [Actinomycetota bacterium]